MLCEYCGSPLPDDGSGRRYCNRTHARKAGRVRQQQRILSEPCPHPGKMKFPDKDEALAKAVRLAHRLPGIPMRAYQCPAGHWHLTRKYARVTWKEKRT